MNEIEKVLHEKKQAEYEIAEIIKKFKEGLPPHVHMLREIRQLPSAHQIIIIIDICIE